jgi:hypothetical protein
MNDKGWLLRAGEYLVGRAARSLPPADCEQRHQEWSAELPVILNAASGHRRSQAGPALLSRNPPELRGFFPRPRPRYIVRNIS